MDLYDFFRGLLPLHEIRIEERIRHSGLDLNEFLDYTQVQLNRFVQNDIDIKNRGISSALLDGTKTIADTKKVQEVIVRMMGSKRQKVSMAVIALVYHQKGIQINSENMDKIASIHGWSSKTSGKKLKDKYNSIRDEIGRTQTKITEEQKQRVIIL